jgi:hypothetical protein
MIGVTPDGRCWAVDADETQCLLYEEHEGRHQYQQQETIMSEAKPTEKKARGPRAPTAHRPLDLAAYVHEATKDWSAEEHAQYARVLDALRGPA